MNPPAPLIALRVRSCATCPTPCARQTDAAFHAETCSVCPLPRPRWDKLGRCAGPGTTAAAFIEREILAPIERAAPALAKVVQVIRHCTVCKGEAKRLDGDGGGSTL